MTPPRCSAHPPLLSPPKRNDLHHGRVLHLGRCAHCIVLRQLCDVRRSCIRQLRTPPWRTSRPTARAPQRAPRASPSALRASLHSTSRMPRSAPALHTLLRKMAPSGELSFIYRYI